MEIMSYFADKVLLVCARLARLVRSLTTDQKVPGSNPVLIELYATFFGHTIQDRDVKLLVLSQRSTGHFKEPTHLLTGIG